MFGFPTKKKQLYVEHLFLHQVSSGKKLLVRAVLNTKNKEISVDFPNKEQKRYLLDKDKPGLEQEIVRVFSQLEN